RDAQQFAHGRQAQDADFAALPAGVEGIVFVQFAGGDLDALVAFAFGVLGVGGQVCGAHGGSPGQGCGAEESPPAQAGFVAGVVGHGVLPRVVGITPWLDGRVERYGFDETGCGSDDGSRGRTAGWRLSTTSPGMPASGGGALWRLSLAFFWSRCGQRFSLW